MGIIEDEDWSEALDTCKIVSPKLSDRLTQLFIIHCFYLTPLRIAHYKREQSILCPMCNGANGSFYHLLWSCPLVQGLLDANSQIPS